MNKNNRVRRAVDLALHAGVATAVALNSSVARAQDDSDVLEGDRVSVTGSRILRSSVETSSPISIINREQIDASGEISISEVLRNLPQNTFGSFHERSGAGSSQGNSTINLRGLGEERTLVLLDGRRVAKSATFGAKTDNLNLIPFAAVERIEILRDGASAVYGSDAIAGVVNVILRKDYEGLHLGISANRPTQDGGDEDAANLVGGISSSKGNITFGVDYTRKSILWDRDRDYTSVGLSSFGFPATFLMFAPDMSPMGPPIFRFLGTEPDPRCPSVANPQPDESSANDFVFNTPDPQFPDSVATERGGGVRCLYNFAATSATQAQLKRQSVFINSNFEITPDLSFFARAISTYNESFGRYAATPQVGGFPFAPTMAATNPNNPTTGVQVILPDLDQNFNQLTTSTTYNGPYDLSIFYRNVPGGFRDSFVDDTYMDLLIGLEGTVDLFRGADWEFALQHSRAKTNDTSTGFANRSGLQTVIDDGSFDIFGVNGPTSPTVAQTFVIDGFENGETTLIGADASIRFDLGELPSGPVSWAWGVEYQDFEHKRQFDAIAKAGNIDGSGQELVDINAGRTVFSAFGEALIPILSNLEVDIAVRYDTYNDFGDTTNPKLGLAYRPVQSLLLRGTYGEGFRAPAFDDLYEPLTPTLVGGNTDSRDVKRCIALGDSNGDGIPDIDQDIDLFQFGTPCGRNEYFGVIGGNPNLGPESSENWTAGFVWSPTADITLGFDYYKIVLEDEFNTIMLSDIMEREAAGDPFFESLVTRDAMDNVLQIDGSVQNIAIRETEGVDLQASYNFGFDSVGDFRLTADFTHIIDFAVALVPGDPLMREAETDEADLKGTLGTNWQRGNFGGQLNINYVSTITNPDFPNLSSWTTFDLQFSWDTPWNGKISVGARNLTDEDPPLDCEFGANSCFYNTHMHDIYGRVPYIRYEQDL